MVSEVSTGGDAVQQDAGLADGGRADGGRADGGRADGGRAGGGRAGGGRAGGGPANGGQADGPPAGGRTVTAVADLPTVDVTRLRVAIARLSRLLRKHELAGLTPTQLAALATVERTGPLRLGDLAAAERIAPSTLTRLVSALEDQGYVRRHAVPADARAWTLVVTATGHAVLERIRQENTLQLADSLLTLSPDQLAALAAALPALEQLANAGARDPAD